MVELHPYYLVCVVKVTNGDSINYCCGCVKCEDIFGVGVVIVSHSTCSMAGRKHVFCLN